MSVEVLVVTLLPIQTTAECKKKEPVFGLQSIEIGAPIMGG
jgi:hypothetical protein